MPKFILVYDSECGPCSRFRQIIDFLDGYDRIEYVSLTDADKKGLLDDVPFYQRHRYFHLITNFSTLSGAQALPDLIKVFPAGRAVSKLIFATHFGRFAVKSCYATLSRLHDGGSCSYEKEEHQASGHNHVTILQIFGQVNRLLVEKSISKVNLSGKHALERLKNS